jgi:calmodulin
MSEHLSIETQNKLKANFNNFDKDQDGLISYQELKELMKQTTKSFIEADLQDLLNETDINEKGQINCKTYIDIITKLNKKNDTDDEIIEVFKIFDKDNSGLISTKKIMDVFLKIDENIKEEEVLQMIKECDTDQDGYLNFEEFSHMVKNK